LGYPNVEAPDYLMQLDLAIYEQERLEFGGAFLEEFSPGQEIGSMAGKCSKQLRFRLAEKGIDSPKQPEGDRT
jgi:hypothetical protein